MGKSYKKNIKDRNGKEKISIKQKIKDFDEQLVFETEEEFMSAFKSFLSKVEPEKRRKYIFAYIRHTLLKREKQIKQLERKKRAASTHKILELSESIDKEKMILSCLNHVLEKQSIRGKQKKPKQTKTKRQTITEEVTVNIIEKSEEIYDSYEEIQILNKLEQGEEIVYNLENLDIYTAAFAFYMKANHINDVYIQNINGFIDLLCILEKDNVITKENVESKLYLVIDILNGKISGTDKHHKQIREEYKRIKNRSEMILEIYKEDRSRPKHDYYYDILEVLLTSPKNYYVIEKLLLEIPEFVNAKKRIQTEEGDFYQPILYTIVDLYIRNYKLELRNQTKDFVPRDYYRKLYYLFIKNPYLEIDKKDIYKILKDFISSIDNANYLKNNKEQILKEIGTMIEGREEKETLLKSETVKDYIRHIEYQILDACNSKRERMHKKYLEETRYAYEKIKSEFVNPSKEQLKQIQRTIGISNRTKRNITMGCDTISFKNDHSYTLSYYDDGSYCFRMHELDFASIIKNTPLEEFMFHSLEKGINVFKEDKRLQIEEGKVIPSVTYEVRIDPNGIVGPLKVYKSTSEVETTYNDIIGYQKDEKLKRFISLYKQLTDDHKPNLDIEIVDNYFLSFFEKLLIEYAATNEIPLLVKGKSDFDIESYMKLHYELCEIYSKIKRSDFEKNI